MSESTQDNKSTNPPSFTEQAASPMPPFLDPAWSFAKAMWPSSSPIPRTTSSAQRA